jgi:hypothetical protein
MREHVRSDRPDRETLPTPDRPRPLPPRPGTILGLQRSAGNAAVAALLARKEGHDLRPARYKERDKAKPPEEEPAEEEGGGGVAGLFGVVGQVNSAIAAVSKLQQTWDELFKSKVTTTFTAIPPMVSDEVQADINRILRHETSRLVCEYVFEKGKLVGVDIKQLLDKGGPPVDTARPQLTALAKDLDGLTELALGDLKDRAAKFIAQRRQSRTVAPESFWWNEKNEWGVSVPAPRIGLVGLAPKELEYGEVFFRPEVGTFGQPMHAGLHPDVRYFNIPDTGTEAVTPRWWLGGQVETKTHGRNVNAVKVDVMDKMPDANKPMGEYHIVVTFDWDESNTLLRCILRGTDEKAFIVGIEREGEPDIGWF